MVCSKKKEINQFYNALVESYNKGKDGKLEDTNFVRDLVFYFAQNDNTGNEVKYLLSHPEKYPFLINSKDKNGHKLSHFYTNFPKMQKFLFEHGLIPELEKKDEELQRIIADNQSVHDSAAVKKTNFIVKELVKSFKANQDELKQAADSYLADIPELLKRCQGNPIRIKLLSLTENEKRSVMAKTSSKNNPVPDDQQFIEVVMSKAKETLETKYLRKKETDKYDDGYPTNQMQYDYTDDNAKVTIPQSIGYVKLLIDQMIIPLPEKKELFVTLTEQNPKLIEQKLSYIRSEFKNITQEQVTKKSEFYKLLDDITDSDKIDKLFKETSNLDLEKIWREQKEFILAKQIYVAATTYGENSSACIKGTWAQIISSVDEIHLELLNKFQEHLEEEKQKEAQKKIITAKNIEGFIEYLPDILIKHVEENPGLKESLSDFALAMVDVEKFEEITLEQQQILAKINQEFSSKIKQYLPNYDGIPTLEEYKIIIDEIANVSGLKIQQLEAQLSQDGIDNKTSDVSNSTIGSNQLQFTQDSEIASNKQPQKASATRKAMYVTMVTSPFIAVGVYAVVALSAGIVEFKPIIAASIFVGIAVLSAICFTMVKIHDKVNEEKGKNPDVSSYVASNNESVTESFKNSKIEQQFHNATSI